MYHFYIFYDHSTSCYKEIYGYFSYHFLLYVYFLDVYQMIIRIVIESLKWSWVDKQSLVSFDWILRPYITNEFTSKIFSVCINNLFDMRDEVKTTLLFTKCILVTIPTTRNFPADAIIFGWMTLKHPIWIEDGPTKKFRWICRTIVCDVTFLGCIICV